MTDPEIADIRSDSQAPTGIRDYLARLAIAIGELSPDAIERVAHELVRTALEGRRIYLIGNGGSASTASHMANDLNKQCSIRGVPRLRALSMTDNVPTITAWANDTDFESVFREQLDNHIEFGDVLIAISTSGNSPNVLAAARLARERRARVVAFTGPTGGALRDLADLRIAVDSEDIGHQEDGHLVLNHVLGFVIRGLLKAQFGDSEADRYD